MKNTTIVALTALLVGSGATYLGIRVFQPRIACGGGILNEQHCALRRAMDKLWAEHVLWTRQFIVSAVAGLEDLDAATQRLLKNQDDIGNAIVPFYGKEAGEQLAKLLKEHIMIAAKLVKAAIAKNDADVKELDAQWHANAAEIATFLSNANPHWTKEALVTMLNEHLRLTTLELQDRLQKDWHADVANYDKVFEQARMMGKDLTDGIIKQFPDKF